MKYPAIFGWERSTVVCPVVRGRREHQRSVRSCILYCFHHTLIKFPDSEGHGNDIHLPYRYGVVDGLTPC
ncbi:hypothetical protein LB505_003362 [Fusarium chuoi]|nr:hypothetical protein LB505_003362 [Fusarium chuoi]